MREPVIEQLPVQPVLQLGGFDVTRLGYSVNDAAASGVRADR